jgi:hypothetical protein
MALADALTTLYAQNPVDILNASSLPYSVARGGALYDELYALLDASCRAGEPPTKAHALAVTYMAHSIEDAQTRPFTPWIERIADAIDLPRTVDEYDRGLHDWSLTCFLRSLPEDVLKGALARHTNAGPETYLHHFGGAAMLLLVSGCISRGGDGPEGSLERARDGLTHLEAKDLPALYAAKELFSSPMSYRSRDGVRIAAALIAGKAKAPLGEVWTNELAGLLRDEHKHAFVADALRPALEGLREEDRDAALRGGSPAYHIAYSHVIAGSSPVVLAETVKSCAEMNAEKAYFGDRVRNMAAVLEKLGAPALPYVEAAFVAAKPAAQIAFSRLDKSERVANALVEMIATGAKEVRQEASEALRVMGSAAQSALAAGAKSKKKAVREACEALLATVSNPSSDPIQAALATLDPAARADIDATLTKVTVTDINATRQATRDAFARDAFAKYGNPFLAAALAGQLNDGTSGEKGYPIDAILHSFHDTRVVEETPEIAALLTHYATHLPSLNDYHLDQRIRPLRPFAKVLAPAIAKAAQANAELSGRIKLFEELLIHAGEALPTSFWSAMLADGSKTVRGLAATALAGREDAIAAVAPHLSSKKGDVRAATADFLAKEARAGAGDALKAALAAEKDAKIASVIEKAIKAVSDASSSDAATSSASTESAPAGDPLVLLAKDKKGKLPKFLATATLPPLTTKTGGTLDEAQQLAFITRLANEGPDLEDGLARAVRAILDPASAGNFGAAIYNAWAQGRDAKQKWAVFQLGVLADPRRVTILAEGLGAQASMGQHHYAAWSLEALGRHGRVLAAAGEAEPTDLGLSWVSYWARAATTESLGNRAREIMLRERDQRGLTDETFAAHINAFIASEAADKSIQSIDLSTSTFTFGGATFKPALDGTKLVLVGADGVRTGVPKRGSKEDKDAHAAEKKRFESLAAQIEHVARREAKRLEIAMVSGRIWPAELFLELAAHPLMKHLVGGLVWKIGDTLFNPSVDGAVTVDYSALSNDAIRAAGKVALPHRIDLDDATRAAWGQHFAESKILPPFEQLGRDLYIDPSDLTPEDKKMKPAALAARLLETGWQHGRPQDAGIFYDSWRLFAGFGVRAVLSHDGLSMSDQSWQTDLGGVNGVSFEDIFGRDLALENVPAVVRSEVARDIKSITR